MPVSYFTGRKKIFADCAVRECASCGISSRVAQSGGSDRRSAIDKNYMTVISPWHLDEGATVSD
jgi:hypothetical protein